MDEQPLVLESFNFKSVLFCVIWEASWELQGSLAYGVLSRFKTTVYASTLVATFDLDSL